MNESEIEILNQKIENSQFASDIEGKDTNDNISLSKNESKVQDETQETNPEEQVQQDYNEIVKNEGNLSNKLISITDSQHNNTTTEMLNKDDN